MDYVEAGIHQAVIYNGDLLEPGMSFVGPAIVEEKQSTAVVGEDASVSVDEYGFLWISLHEV